MEQRMRSTKKFPPIFALLLAINALLYGCQAGDGGGLDENGIPIVEKDSGTGSDANDVDVGSEAESGLYKEVQVILAAYQCTSCHTSASAAQGLVLTSGSVYDNIVDINSSQQPVLMLIEPFSSETSYLVKKMRGDSDISGSQMPIGGPYASTEDIQTIVDWIDAGAER